MTSQINMTRHFPTKSSASCDLYDQRVVLYHVVALSHTAGYETWTDGKEWLPKPACSWLHARVAVSRESLLLMDHLTVVSSSHGFWPFHLWHMEIRKRALGDGVVVHSIQYSVHERCEKLVTTAMCA